MPPLSLYSLGRTGIARLLLGSADQFYAKGISEIAPEPAGHGLPLSKCEAYNRVYEQSYGSS
jgi:hypothetical protein